MTPTTLASLAALGAALSWALGSLLFSRALAHAAPGDGAREPLVAPAAANLFKNLLALAAFATWAACTGVHWPPAAAWPLLLASGAAGFALGDALYFAALPRIGVQKSAMLAELNVPFTALLSFAFFGERFGPWLLAAMAIVLTGVTLVVSESAPREELGRRALRAGIACALGAVLFQSLGAVLCHAGLADIEPFAGMLVRIAGGCAAAIVLAPLSSFATGRSARAELASLAKPLHTRALWPALGLAALVSSVAGLPLYHYALSELESGRAMVLLATTPLFTLPLGHAFGERHGARAWLGTFVGFAGVLAVVWALRATHA